MTKDTSKNKQRIGNNGSRENREDFAFYIGIDLGDKDSDVCVLDQRGEVSREFLLMTRLASCGIYPPFCEVLGTKFWQQTAATKRSHFANRKSST